MRLAMLGLGRMGGNMVQRLLQGGHKVVAYDVDPRRATELAAVGAAPATTTDAVIAATAPPRVCWTVVPAGQGPGVVGAPRPGALQQLGLSTDEGPAPVRALGRRVNA